MADYSFEELTHMVKCLSDIQKSLCTIDHLLAHSLTHVVLGLTRVLITQDSLGE